MTLSIAEKTLNAQQKAVEYFFNGYPNDNPYEKLMALGEDDCCTDNGFEFAYPEIFDTAIYTPYLQKMVARLALTYLY